MLNMTRLEILSMGKLYYTAVEFQTILKLTEPYSDSFRNLEKAIEAIHEVRNGRNTIIDCKKL